MKPAKFEKKRQQAGVRVMAAFAAKEYVLLERLAGEYLTQFPDDAFGVKAMASSLLAQSRFVEAEPWLQRAVTLAPDDDEAINNLAVFLVRMGRLDEATPLFERACKLEPSNEWRLGNLARCYRLQGRVDEAEAKYRQALALSPGDLALKSGLGELYYRVGRLNESIPLLEQAARQRPMDAELLAAALVLSKRYQEAVQVSRSALAAMSDEVALLAQLLHAAQHLCDWILVAEVATRLHVICERERQLQIPPFLSLTIPGFGRKRHKRIAESFGASRFKDSVSMHVQPADAASKPRLRLGYMSADFHEHATAYLLAGVLEQHDRNRVEVFTYSYGVHDTSPMRHRLAGASDVFRDMYTCSYRESAEAIAADRIDILIDLKGWTQNERLAISSMRPAPVIVNWLGYPGSLGLPVLADYIIGDKWVTPIEHADGYSEKIAQLPHSYQPNDNTRIVRKGASRVEHGLPEGAVVYCSFNQCYKITEPVFKVWCEVLRQVPNGVLWLLRPADEAARKLIEALAGEGIEPERLIWAGDMDLDDHLARLTLADVALDTSPVGSHTTASDALRAGVPLVTCPGEIFASRVAASLLAALDMESLIVSSWEAYIALAVKMGVDANYRQQVRSCLAGNLLTAPLFDTPRFTRNLERLYVSIWQNHLAGKHEHLLSVDD
ncbi:O-linked N-acetylglucosamine transferase, SPINDLY family protein [Chitinimonas sp. JJ19]|uniref:O-linked N-acetylglucosamine transferase, SPINDLY family protein n=1 Tax=Chitinimonas sp. JJ19 TaxID=3109352 RepID=UPI001A60E1A8|nr:tetratricopeptide repeat protein [Chitinimonas sp.]